MNRLMAVAVMGAFTGLCAEAGAGATEAEAKATRFAAKSYDLDSGEFEIAFGDGTKVGANISEFNPEIVKQLAFHGLGQKAGDSYAGAKGDFTKAREAAQSVIDQLKQGEWRSARGEGEAKPRLGELAEAIARVKGIAVDKAMAAVEKIAQDAENGPAKLKEWRAHPKVKAAIAAIRSEKAQAELAAAEEKDLEIEIAA